MRVFCVISEYYEYDSALKFCQERRTSVSNPVYNNRRLNELPLPDTAFRDDLNGQQTANDDPLVEENVDSSMEEDEDEEGGSDSSDSSMDDTDYAGDRIPFDLEDLVVEVNFNLLATLQLPYQIDNF